MNKRIQLCTAMLGMVMLCGVSLAQEPVQDIDKKVHPNLAAAQAHVVEANKYVTEAQKGNEYDMKGHAEKARELLAQVNQELKAAAQAADAAAAAAQKGKK